MNLVIDASVALKWIKKEEEYRDIAKKIYLKHKSGNQVIIVPNLIFLEVANALVTKSDTFLKNIEEGLKFIFDSDLNIYETSREIMLQTTKLAKKYKTSVYDMLYAVIAKENKTILITADEKFIEKTGFKFVKHIKDY